MNQTFASKFTLKMFIGISTVALLMTGCAEKLVYDPRINRVIASDAWWVDQFIIVPNTCKFDANGVPIPGTCQFINVGRRTLPAGSLCVLPDKPLGLTTATGEVTDPFPQNPIGE